MTPGLYTSIETVSKMFSCLSDSAQFHGHGLQDLTGILAMPKLGWRLMLFPESDGMKRAEDLLAGEMRCQTLDVADLVRFGLEFFLYSFKCA